MANGIQDSLLETFTQVAGGLASNLSGLVSAIGGGAANTSSSGSGDSEKSTGGGALSIATTVLESGLGIVPLVAGLIGLFSGGESSAPPPLVKYAMPEKMNFDYANTANGAAGIDFDQFGMPRPTDGARDRAASAPATSQSGAAAQQINVTVHAMDSKSFLDHSNEIAQAVRVAMLNLHSINDVVSDL